MNRQLSEMDRQHEELQEWLQILFFIGFWGGIRTIYAYSLPWYWYLLYLIFFILLFGIIDKIRKIREEQKKLRDWHSWAMNELYTGYWENEEEKREFEKLIEHVSKALTKSLPHPPFETLTAWKIKRKRGI